MALTGNKVEWSEIYTLFKLLGEKQVHAGDGNLNKIENLVYPIIKILRQEECLNYEFRINPGNIIIILGEGKENLQLPVSEFKKQAEVLFQKIKLTSGSFQIPETETFMKSIHCNRIKAKSSDKTDFKIVIHDLRTGVCPTLGFSIKSKMGSNSTLINSSGATNFTYSINGVSLSCAQIKEINAIETKSKIRDRISKIKELGGKLIFESIDSPIFNNNLVIIDSNMPEIISELLLLYFSGKGSRINQLSEILQSENPMHYNTIHNHKFYEYKIKRLLSDAALGMKPATVWTGTFEANGGYLVVKENGEVLCYHIYNRNEFEDYLLNTSFIDTPSSSKHGFGTINVIDGKQFFKLNLQIRFI